MAWETWDADQVCAWVSDHCEMDPAPWRKAGVTGAQLPTLSRDVLTNEFGLSNLLSRKALREIEGLLASGPPHRHPPPPHPSQRARPPAGAPAGESKAWMGYIVAVLAILSHLFWHPAMTQKPTSVAGAVTTTTTAAAAADTADVAEYAILTVYTDNIAGYAEQATLVKQLYCLRHGYRLIVERETALESESTPVPSRTRHPSWLKMHFIRKHLPRAKFLVWMDADVLVMNLRVPLSVITERAGDLHGATAGGGEGCALWACQDQDIVGAEDWKARDYLGVPPDYLINAGVLVFRNGPAARSIVESAWTLGDDAAFIPRKYDLYYDRKPEGERGWPWEQGALWEVLTNSREARAATCVSRSSFNTLTTPLTEWGTDAGGSTGSFVFHMTDWSAADRGRYAGAVLRYHLDPEANPLPRIQRG